ncbi:MAG TPA: carboxypeptidase M32 [Anaerolineaceae bacterium]
MEEKINRLKFLLGEIYDLGAAQGLLSWDQQTYMPPAGSEDRAYILSTLASLEHQCWTSSELQTLLSDLKKQSANLDPDSDDYNLIRVAARRMDKYTQVPARWVAEFAQTTSLAHEIWAKARAESNFSKFQPALEKIVDLRREYASFFAPYAHVYDPLLDDFEPGMKTSEVREIFDRLRPQQVALVSAIASQPPVDDSFLHQSFPEQGQWDFGVEVISKFGFDWQRGRQDRSAHPFTSGFGLDDVRITTRFVPGLGTASLFGTMHECGHAFYDLGLPRAYRRTPLLDGASMAFHESQSRMWENLVGRSKSFWEYFYPRFQEVFPVQVGNVTLDAFYRAINKVQPSFIRVEADEATYNLHIMLRLEIEIAMMEGSLAVKDLPEAWNERMKSYLGLTPPDDAHGVLQDIHWSGGMIGYFPTYALGNLLSVQLWECIQKDLPNLDDQIKLGQFNELLQWTRQNVHLAGAKYEPQVLAKRITGSTMDPQPYVNYLQKKYSEIYHL